MDNNIFTLMIVLIIVIFGVIYYFYYCYGYEMSLNLSYKKIKFKKLQKQNNVDHILDFGEDIAIELNKNQALMVFCEIPKDYLYWGISGFLYDYEKDLKDEIDEILNFDNLIFHLFHL